jgi:hypothetical protein
VKYSDGDANGFNLGVDWAYVRPARLGAPDGRLARHHPAGVFGLLVLVVFVVLGVFGEHLAPYPPDELSVGTPLEGPSLAHPAGLNNLGQDVFSRIVAGARISLIISFTAVFLGAGSGAFLGILGGYYGRWIDYLVQRSGEPSPPSGGSPSSCCIRAEPEDDHLSIGIGALFGGTASCEARRSSSGTDLCGGRAGRLPGGIFPTHVQASAAGCGHHERRGGTAIRRVRPGLPGLGPTETLMGPRHVGSNSLCPLITGMWSSSRHRHQPGGAWFELARRCTPRIWDPRLRK